MIQISFSGRTSLTILPANLCFYVAENDPLLFQNFLVLSVCDWQHDSEEKKIQLRTVVKAMTRIKKFFASNQDKLAQEIMILLKA